MLLSGHHKALLLIFGVPLFTLSALSAAAMALGIRINTSYSLPLGLYATTSDSAAELIEFCPAEPFASESASRSYRTRGFACPDGAVPLLKPVVARPGDVVIVSEKGIIVNGHLLPKTYPIPFDASGRPLKAWPTGMYGVREGTVWVRQGTTATSALTSTAQPKCLRYAHASPRHANAHAKPSD